MSARTERVFDGLVASLKALGAFSIAAMMLLTCADVIMRAFGRPIEGAVEISGFLATVALACAMPHTHREKGHVGVDMVMRRLPGRIRAAVDVKTGILSAIVFGVISRQSFLYAGDLKRSGEMSMTLEFPSYVFVYFIAFAFAVLTLLIFADIIRSFKKAFEK
ncbi:conserved membrane hypothetical protein [Candidatus Desulfarcum epimagneticum]|uniref:Tripartite ATP-independent periplasmic transporters DctQ component domain-containing protein n=1 Tax=uncultured Desulfobacteraceae bacterium TaxID=218296 RepID=A0A484HI63_9BACT|nr:conserved membrane hypothetical protein [uncultured Desulfobacteraceae bacterium]